MSYWSSSCRILCGNSFFPSFSWVSIFLLCPLSSLFTCHFGTTRLEKLSLKNTDAIQKQHTSSDLPPAFYNTRWAKSTYTIPQKPWSLPLPPWTGILNLHKTKKILAWTAWKDLSGQEEHSGKGGVLDLYAFPAPVLNSSFPFIERGGSPQEVAVAINKTRT